MHFLIISDSVPFPPLNGKELPTAKLFEYISARHSVDLLVLSKNKENDLQRIQNIPINITLINIIKIRNKHKVKRLSNYFISWNKIVDNFVYDDDIVLETLKEKKYDWVWIYPLSNVEFISHCKTRGIHFFSKMAVGLNDSLTYLYRDSINELKGSRQLKRRYVTDWLLSFFIAFREKKLLKTAHLIRVQTNYEEKKLKKVLGESKKPKILVAPNGTKEELFKCSYQGIDSPYILFMTHLDGGRIDESSWFIKKVWPVIIKQIPETRLLIVGKPPKKILPHLQQYKSIITHGYASDLVALYNQIRIAVIPTFHGTGLINRLLDALSAGVPAVSTPNAIATFTDLNPGEHILSAKKPGNFAQQVIDLYNDKPRRLQLAEAGRKFALQFPTWKTSCEIIEDTLIELI